MYQPNSQSTANGGGRKPINAGDDTTIFTAQPSSQNQNQSYSANTNNHKGPATSTNYGATQNPSHLSPQQNTTHSTQQHTQWNSNHHAIRQPVSSNSGSGSGTHRQTSPTRSVEGYRIAKRELWWKEPERSHKVNMDNRTMRVDHVTPKVQCYNPDYNPQRQHSKLIESKKLEWNATHG
jgi:hypothetical protein